MRKIFYAVSDHDIWGETGAQVWLQTAKKIMVMRHIVAENQAPEAGSKNSISGYVQDFV